MRSRSLPPRALAAPRAGGALIFAGVVTLKLAH